MTYWEHVRHCNGGSPTVVNSSITQNKYMTLRSYDMAIFPRCVTGPLWGKTTVPVHQSASYAELWCVFYVYSWINGWINSGVAGDLTRHDAHVVSLQWSGRVYYQLAQATTLDSGLFFLCIMNLDNIALNSRCKPCRLMICRWGLFTFRVPHYLPIFHVWNSGYIF